MTKFKVTNVCDRGVVESLPGVTRIALQPGESAIIESVGKTTATQIVHFIKGMRGPMGSRDLEFTEIFEDQELVEKIKEEEEKKEEFVPVEEEEVPSLFSLLDKKEEE